MGTSKCYSSPKWPGVNHVVGAAASTSAPSDQQITGAVGVFAAGYKEYLNLPKISSIARKGRGPTGRIAKRELFSRGGKGTGSGGVARMRAARSGAGLAHFISTAQISGINAALQEFDLSDLRDKPLDEFLESVAGRLSAGGGLLDDDALKRAMAETINELAETVDSVDAFEELLTSGIIDIKDILIIYYANMLAANFEQKEYSLVRARIPREYTSSFFDRAREIIRAIVRDELSAERNLATIDWNTAEGQRVADGINLEVLEILIP